MGAACPGCAAPAQARQRPRAGSLGVVADGAPLRHRLRRTRAPGRARGARSGKRSAPAAFPGPGGDRARRARTALRGARHRLLFTRRGIPLPALRPVRRPTRGRPLGAPAAARRPPRLQRPVLDRPRRCDHPVAQRAARPADLLTDDRSHDRRARPHRAQRQSIDQRSAGGTAGVALPRRRLRRGGGGHLPLRREFLLPAVAPLRGQRLRHVAAWDLRKRLRPHG